MSNNSIVGFAAVPTGAAYSGAIASDATNGEVYVGRAGTWVKLLTSTAGGSVTLAGDVTGPSSSNTVVSLTGSASVVAMNAAALRWGETLTPSLFQGTRTSDAATHDLTVSAQGAFSGSTGTNRNSGSILYWTLAPASGGTAGSHKWLVGSAFQANLATAGLRIGDASVPLERLDVLGNVRLEATGNAQLYHARQTVDVGTGSLYITSQGAAVGATGSNRDSGSLVFDIGPAVSGGLPGSHNFYVQGSPRLRIEDTLIHSYINTIEWDQGATAPLLRVVQRAVDASCVTLGIRSQAAASGSTGTNRNSGSIAYDIGAAASGGTPGVHAFQVQGANRFWVRDTALQSFVNTIQWDWSLTAPVLEVAGHIIDLPCVDLRIKSQTPFAGSVNNKVPGNLIYEVPAPAAGGDPPGWHSFVVSGTEYVNITTNAVKLNTRINFTNSFLGSGTNAIQCEAATASNTAGGELNILGQHGGPGNSNGGNVVIASGQPSGTGVPGAVSLSLFGTPMIQAASMNGQNIVSLCTSVTSGDYGAGIANRAVFLKNATDIGNGDPSTGCAFYANDGSFATKSDTGWEVTWLSDVHPTSGTRNMAFMRVQTRSSAGTGLGALQTWRIELIEDVA